MTPQQCTKLQNGQKGMIIPILPSLVQAANRQHRQDSLIHLEDASSHGVDDRLIKSLSNRLPSVSDGSGTKFNHPKIVHSTSNSTRMYKNSLDSTTSVSKQATKHGSVSLSHSKLAEIISLNASLHNPLTGWDQDHIIREMNERATCEE